jgi:hypothetical protein
LIQAPEHDCLEVLDEVFFSWPDLTDSPFVIWTLSVSWMTAALSWMAHILPNMQ